MDLAMERLVINALFLTISAFLSCCTSQKNTSQKFQNSTNNGFLGTCNNVIVKELPGCPLSDSIVISLSAYLDDRVLTRGSYWILVGDNSGTEYFLPIREKPTVVKVHYNSITTAMVVINSTTFDRLMLGYKRGCCYNFKFNLKSSMLLKDDIIESEK